METKIAERIEKANLSLPSKEKSKQIVKSWEEQLSKKWYKATAKKIYC